jgi:hypothetical protein
VTISSQVFVLACPLYNNIRRNLFVVILGINGKIDLNIILYRNTELSTDQIKDSSLSKR